MASPGYPQMGPGFPGQNQMGGGMPPRMPPRPQRHGTSKAVPVVVSAGLAVGVFCGLLFGLGTDKADAKPTGSTSGNNVKKAEEPGSADPGAAPAGIGATTGLPKDPPKVAAGSGSAGGGIGSGTVAMAGSGTGSGSAATKAIKLTIDVEPDAAAAAASITIDGAQITGKTTDVALDKKQVHVVINATGFHSIDKKVDISGGDEVTVKIEMLKRGGGGGVGSPGFGGASTGGNHVPTAPPKQTKKPPNNGIIDI